MKAKTLIIAALLAVATLPATAQFSQLGPKNEFMLKAELGYGPFMGNTGDAGEYGFYLSNSQNNVGLNVMAGINISQDWFVGGGLGYSYFANLRDLGDGLHGVQVFADMDFRPIWKAVMGLDYQPVTIKWAPLVGARIGGSLLLGPSDTYGTTFTPLFEVYGGANWYYMHGLRNMEHNWHSFYATLGVAYMQQTVFLPIRLGWRW